MFVAAHTRRFAIDEFIVIGDVNDARAYELHINIDDSHSLTYFGHDFDQLVEAATTTLDQHEQLRVTP